MINKNLDNKQTSGNKMPKNSKNSKITKIHKRNKLCKNIHTISKTP